MSNEIILNWCSGKPNLTGLYFVAVKYGEAAGEFQFAEWNSENWELQTKGEVIAYIDIQSFKNQLNIQWPEVVQIVSESSKSIDGSLWEEV